MWWSPARWPLRIRVALAFLASTLVALAGLGVFVHVRMGVALDERLRDTIAVEADRLAALSAQDRSDAVRALGGDVHAEALTPQGDVRTSSRLVAAPLLGSSTDATLNDTGFREGVMRVFDDDAAAAGQREPEREAAVLLVRRTGDGYLVVGTSREDADEALAQLRNQLLVGVPLALIVAGGLGYAVAGAGLRPIERLRARAATISARSAGERLPLPSADDELRRLAVTLNAMLERLDEGLRRERTFVAEASHELRTPLTLMLTEVELALAQPRPPEELTRALHSVNDEIRRLIALAEDLLGRAGAGESGLPIEAGPVDLVAVASRVAVRFRAAAGDRAIRMTAPRSVEVSGDATRLDRALSNLVDNALRHGAGDVVIELRAVSDGAVVTVTDEGAGFPSDDMSHGEGAGIGLSIVREIARAHGGTVEVGRVNDQTCVRVELASPRA
jgi:signal transduction histidine kinase